MLWESNGIFNAMPKLYAYKIRAEIYYNVECIETTMIRLLDAAEFHFSVNHSLHQWFQRETELRAHTFSSWRLFSLLTLIFFSWLQLLFQQFHMRNSGSRQTRYFKSHDNIKNKNVMWNNERREEKKNTHKHTSLTQWFQWFRCRKTECHVWEKGKKKG